MKLIKLKCEGCGAILKVNEELTKVHCNYCGTEFLIDDECTNHIYRKVDEARIKEAEISERIRLKELELEERKILSREKNKLIKIVVSIILGIIGIITWIIGVKSGDSDSGFYGISMFAMVAIMWIWIFNIINNNDKNN